MEQVLSLSTSSIAAGIGAHLDKTRSVLTRKNEVWNCTPTASPAVVATANTQSINEVRLEGKERTSVCVCVREREREKPRVLKN